MLSVTGSANSVLAGTTYKLRFEVQGTSLRLYDGGSLVLQATDGELSPAASYVGLQTTQGTGHAAFDNVRVELF